MSFGTLLFSPEGRIGPGNFWRGYIIVLAINLVVGVISYMAGANNAPAQLVAFAIGLVLLWCTFALFAKRLHDTGASGGWAVLIGVIYTIVGAIGAAVIMMTLAGDLFQLMVDDPAYAQSDTFNEELTERLFLPITAFTLVAALVLGFIMASLRSDPGQNQYGQPPAGVDNTFN